MNKQIIFCLLLLTLGTGTLISAPFQNFTRSVRQHKERTELRKDMGIYNLETLEADRRDDKKGYSAPKIDPEPVPPKTEEQREGGVLTPSARRTETALIVETHKIKDDPKIAPHRTILQEVVKNEQTVPDQPQEKISQTKTVGIKYDEADNLKGSDLEVSVMEKSTIRSSAKLELENTQGEPPAEFFNVLKYDDSSHENLEVAEDSIAEYASKEKPKVNFPKIFGEPVASPLKTQGANIPHLSFSHLLGLSLMPQMRSKFSDSQYLKAGSLYLKASSTGGKVQDLASNLNFKGDGDVRSLSLAYQWTNDDWSFLGLFGYKEQQGDLYFFDQVGRSLIAQGSLGGGLDDSLIHVQKKIPFSIPLEVGVQLSLPTGKSEKFTGLGSPSYAIDFQMGWDNLQAYLAWTYQGDFDSQLQDLELANGFSLQLAYGDNFTELPQWSWGTTFYVAQNPWRKHFSGELGEDVIYRLGFGLLGRLRQLTLAPEISIGLNHASSDLSFGLGVVIP